MTNEEAKEAFFSGVAVKSQGIRYKCISAIIYRKDKDGKLIVSAEMLDNSGNSRTVARTQDIEVI